MPPSTGCSSNSTGRCENQTQESPSLRRNEHRNVSTKKKNRIKLVEEHISTSWEFYNIFLKGLAEELINLGASKRIKIVAFQLWALYLQRADVAFISKEEKKLPALSLGFRNKDVKAVYGVKNLRKKLFSSGIGKRRRSVADSSSSKNTKVTKLKRPKIESSEEKEADENQGSSTDVEPVASVKEQLQTKRKKKIFFKSSAQKALKEISDQKKKSSLSRKTTATKTRNKVKRLVYDRRCRIFGKKSPNLPVTTVTLITILRVALQIVGDEIFLGDILRWICEGRLSVNHPEKFVLSYDLNVRNDLMGIRRQAFQLDIRNFTHNLNLYNLPTPNLFQLAKRYCEELCLPNEFSQLMLKLMTDSNVAMNYSKCDSKSFPDYECRVMAFAIFIFKLLFSLDDFTEYQLSDFADSVNEIQKSDDIPQMFSWRRWVKYMECRKAILSQYNVPINNMSYNDVICKEKIFVHYWKKVKSNYKATGRTINGALLSSLSQECDSLSLENVNNEESVSDYPVSFTPFKTLLEYLQENHDYLFRRRSRNILSENFSLHSVKFATSAELCSRIADQLNLNVEVCSPSEYFDEEFYKRPDFSLLALSKTSLPRADLPVTVLIERHKPPEMQWKEAETSTFQPSIRIHDSDSESERQNLSIKMFRPPRYWCFHECHKRISVEEFEDVAKKNFSISFLWLLRECASMLRCSVKELYFELIFVETTLNYFYCQSRRKKRFQQVMTDEW